MSFIFDCILSSYLLVASLTIWCAQTTPRSVTVETGLETVLRSQSPGVRPAKTALSVVEPALASLPHALGSLGCLIAALALTIGAPFELRYAAVAVFGVAAYLILINLSHLIEDWQNGVSAAQMVCVRSLLPAILASPMLVAGLRLI